jgi:outer membrane protein assembly factor BamB
LNAKRFTLILLAMVGLILLSGCTSAAARGTSNWPGLAADADAAYLADGSQIFAVRLSDGAELWRYPAKADAKTSFFADPILLGDGRMVIGSAGTSDRCLYVVDTTRVDASTKSPSANCFFAAAKDRWIAPPLVVGDTVYAPNNDGTLYVVNLTSGELLWSLEIGSGGHLWSAPVTDGTNLYLSSLDHNLYAISLEQHKVAWSADLGGSVSGSPSLSTDGSTLYVGSFASKVFALEAATGSILWQVDTKGWVWDSPTVDGDVVYVADIKGQFYALDGATGHINWSVQPADAITGSPLVAGDQIIVTTESGAIFAVDKDGKTVWPANIKGKLYTSAVQSGDLFIVAPLSTGADFYLTILSADGKVLRNYKPQ